MRGSVIRLEDLPSPIHPNRIDASTPAFKPGVSLSEMERQLIRHTLEFTGGNRTHSAELLGIGVRTLQRKIRAYGLSIRPTRRRSRGVPS